MLVERGLLLKVGTVVDATLIAAPSSTKNKDSLRDPEMHSAQKGNQWHFGMKAHIGVDADSGLVHTVRGTSANVNDVVEGNALLHGEEEVAFGDAGYQGVDKRGDANAKVLWRVAMRPGLRKKLDKARPVDALVHKVEYLKASVRAQGGASVSSDQAPLRLREGALSGIEEKHGAARDAVRLVQSVDGAGQVAGNGQDGISQRDGCVYHPAHGLRKAKYHATRA